MKHHPAFLATLLLASQAQAATTLKLVERATTDAISLHAGSAHDNVGDILTFSNEVFDATNTKKLGTDQGFCIRLILGTSYECHWTLAVAKGQLVVDGPFHDASDTTLAITGGTGAYAGASGELHLHARDSKGSSYDFTYELK